MDSVHLYQQLAELKQKSSFELREIWLETFGREAPNAYSVALLATRLAAHRIAQATEAAQPKPSGRRSRIQYFPQPGTQRTRYYKGKAYVVRETQQGFEFNGQLYQSYSAIALEITGNRRSGLTFFKLKPNAPQHVGIFRETGG